MCLVSILYALYCHRLNLVIVDTCSRNVTTRKFFGIVEKLYASIEGSTKRHGLFQDVQKRLHGYDGLQAQNESANQPGNIHKGKTKTLKLLFTTLWSTRYDNLDAIQTILPVVVSTFDEITTKDSYDRDSASNALYLPKSINFEFCLCLATLAPLLKKNQRPLQIYTTI